MLIAADMADASAPAMIIDEVLPQTGRIDALVNNAGRAHFGRSQDLTTVEFDELIGLNLRGPLMLTGLAATHMAQSGGGSVVNISSVFGAVGSAHSSLYAASKGAIDAATRALAAEWGPSGVRVNAIRPGLTRSDATAFAMGDERIKRSYEAGVPLGRVGEGADVAELVTFLLSTASSYITGQVINVDGGVSTTSPSVGG